MFKSSFDRFAYVSWSKSSETLSKTLHLKFYKTRCHMNNYSLLKSWLINLLFEVKLTHVICVKRITLLYCCLVVKIRPTSIHVCHLSCFKTVSYWLYIDYVIMYVPFSLEGLNTHSVRSIRGEKYTYRANCSHFLLVLFFSTSVLYTVLCTRA